MPRRRLLLWSATSLVLGVVIVFGAITPAEFNYDPFGVGRLSGLSRLWAEPEENIDPNSGAVRRAREYPVAYRTDMIEIPLSAVNEGGYEIEYKVQMLKDAALVYRWEAAGLEDPRDLEFDFHGHTQQQYVTDKMTVSSYKLDRGVARNGSLIAPFDGIHGWYFKNESDKPIVIRIQVSGFYELIPPGREGNEGRIIANRRAGS